MNLIIETVSFGICNVKPELFVDSEAIQKSTTHLFINRPANQYLFYML